MNQRLSNSLQTDKNLHHLLEAYTQFTKTNNNANRRIGPHPYPGYYANPGGNMYPAPYKQPYINPAMKAPGGNRALFQVRMEKVSMHLVESTATNQTINNDQQDLLVIFNSQARTVNINVNEKSALPQQEYEINQVPKLKIEIRIEEGDLLDYNGNDNIITIITNKPIKQSKLDASVKKQQLNINPTLLNREDGKQIQVVLRLHKDYKQNPQHAKFKFGLYEHLKQYISCKLQFVGFDDQYPKDIDKKKDQMPSSQKDLQKEEEIEQVPQQDLLMNDKEMEQMFPKLGDDQLNQIFKYKDHLEKKNTYEDKQKKLFDELRIKQFKQNQYSGDKKSFRCPVHKCSKVFPKISQMKSHVKKSHYKLTDIDFTVDDNGEFRFNDKALDYCLILYKCYPNFVKSIINDMKQRKDGI